MRDFEFGSQEHIDGLSRKALEADFRFVVDRMREAEGEWERLKEENEKLEKKLVQYELFCEVVGDPAHEFAGLRRRLHNLERENDRLRKLAQGNWYIAMSERAVLRTMDPHPDEDGYSDYIETLDAAITEAKARMLELGIEVE